MKKHLLTLSLLVLFALSLLAGCAETTKITIIPTLTPDSAALATPSEASPAVPAATPTEALSVAVAQEQLVSGPQVVGQEPLVGQRLSLSGAIQITFDRAMEPRKTEAAWRFQDVEGKPVAGKISWPEPRTLNFQPEKALAPASAYVAVLSTAAAGADGEALGAEIRLEFQTVEALSVGQVFPASEAEEMDAGTNITVIFNRPVVPLLIAEEQGSLPQPLKISPEVSGQGEWVNSSVYVFQPEALLNSGTRYHVTVAAGLADVGGGSLQDDFAWSFTTRAPKIAHFGLKNGLQDPTELVENVLLNQAFVITFLQPMEAESVKAATTLVNRETKRPFPTSLKWNKDFTELTIEPLGRYTIASFYDLAIAKTALAQDGGALAEGLLLKFSTVPLPRILETLPAQGSQAAEYWIHIRFSSPMNYGSIKGKIQISPEQPKESQYWYYDPNTWELNIWGLKPSTDYVVRLQAGMADIYGNLIKDDYSFSFRTHKLSSYGWMLLPWTPLVYRAKGAQEFFFEYTNLDSAEISLYKVSLADFNLLLQGKTAMTDFVPGGKPLKAWQPAKDGNVENKRTRTKITLEDGQGKPLQPGYYFLGFDGAPLGYDSNYFQGAIFVVATDNITFKATKSDALAWVTDLETGAPVAGVPVTFYDAAFKELGNSATNKDGVAALTGQADPYYAVAESEGRLALASLDWGSGVAPGDYGVWENYYGNVTAPFAYVYTERPLYRPGQEVYFKGIVRANDDLHYSLPVESKVYVTISHWGEQMYAEYLPLSKMGTFAGTFKLGDEVSLGSYDISVRYAPDSEPFGYLSFRVAEYRKPEFQVTASASPAGLLAGDKASFGLDATYYSGGSVGNANLEWFLQTSPYYYQPSAAYSEFNFMDWERDVYWQSPTGNKVGVLNEGQGNTDENGHFELAQALSLGESKVSQQVTFNANVTDVAGNLVSGHSSVVVHQTPVYAGIHSLAYIGVAGEKQRFELVTLDWDSQPVPFQDITVDFVRREWYSVQEQDAQEQLRWVTSVKEIAVEMDQKVKTDKEGRATVAFYPPSGGVYKAIVTIRDNDGHVQRASAYIWVSSDEYVPWRQTNDRSFNLIADKDTYTPGDTAEILLAQPFEHDVYALVTYERGHIYQQEVVLLKGNSTIYKLPITKEMAPAAYFSVTVVSGAEKSGTPDFKMGLVRFSVDTSQQALDVSVTTDKATAGPGDEVTYTVETKDLQGKPVPAEISLAVVDKAVLALAPSNSAPILDQFYSEQGLAVRTSLGIVLNAEDYNANYQEGVTDGESSGSGGGGKGEGDLGIISVREDFRDTAFYVAQVMTDELGKAQVKVKMPENLTTWVVDVRGVTDDSRVGQATGDLLSTKAMFIQLQTPRFFVNGDQAQIGALVHNNTAEALKVNVSLDATGVEIKSVPEQVVEVPAKQQAYVTWDIAVGVGVERVDFIAHARSGELADDSKPTLGTLTGQGIPVYTYSVPEVVGTSGIIPKADTFTEAIQLPTTLNFEDAKLTVEVAPSLAASMESSLAYLEDFPYLCLEQTVSRFLPNVVTSRALKLAGQPELKLQSNLDAQVNSALQRIYAKQNSDGGWGWWDSQQSDPQTSAYVILGLLEAKEAGYAISGSAYANGISFLRDRLPTLNQNAATWTYNRQAFILYVLARAGELQASKTLAIFNNRHALSLYGKAYLAQAIYILDSNDKRIATLMSDLSTAAVVSAAGTHWEETSHDYWNWNTDLRTTAIVLDTFVRIDSENLLAVNAVRWLMAHRQSGHWQSTQETTWSLLALTDWLVASKEFDTNYQFAIGLNGSLLKEATASPENLTELQRINLRLQDLITDAANYLVITRGAGTGNLYYSAYLAVTLPVEKIEPLDQGMVVSRQYFTLDDPKKPITEIKRGELVRVRVTLVVPDSMHYVVLNDPLPAGLEAIDASLATSPELPTSYTRQDFDKRGWGWWYFEHIELRDEKVVLSSQYLPAGTYVFTYMARASTLGTFKVIPPTANEFYFPDVAGRGAGSLFIVK